MAQLTADSPRIIESGVDPVINDLPVLAAVAIFEGSACGVTAAGYTRQLDIATPDVFVGFCDKAADNTAGASAEINVRLISRGVFKLAVTGAVITSIGATVYASDGNVFTLTAGSNVAIGKVHRFISTGVAMVAVESASLRSI